MLCTNKSTADRHQEKIRGAGEHSLIQTKTSGVRVFFEVHVAHSSEKMLGSLSALGSLQSSAAAKQQREAEAILHEKKSQVQLRKIEELKNKRDKLIEQLHTSAAKADQVLQDVDNNGTASCQSDVRITKAYCQQLREKLNVYKLAGVAVVESDHDSKVLCFTTSYRGVYMESYHVKLQRLSSGYLKVTHHDLPAFIISSKLPENLEVKDLPSFVHPIRELLAMYVCRREEVKQAETKFSAVLHIGEKSGPLDFLCCHLDIGPNLQAEITLKYSELTSAVPTTVNIVPVRKGAGVLQEGLPDSVKFELQYIFCQNKLSSAIALALELLVNHFRSQTEPSREPA